MRIGHGVALPPTKQGSAEWLEQRRGGIGGSDMAQIMGADDPLMDLSLMPFDGAGPHAVWASKVRGVDTPETIAMRCGTALESTVLDLLAEHADINIREADGSYRHPDHEWCRGSLDGVVVDVSGDLIAGAEAKTSSSYGWPDGPPAYYVVQVQWYMFVLGLERFYLGCLFSRNRFDWWVIEADPALQAELFDVARCFWFGFVVPEQLPPVDWSAECLDNIGATKPAVEENREPVQLSPLLDELVREREELRAEIKRLSHQRDTIAARIIADMPAKRARGSQHSVTLVQGSTLDRNRFAAEYPDEYRACFRPQPDAFELSVAKAEFPEIVAECQRAKRPYVTVKEVTK